MSRNESALNDLREKAMEAVSHDGDASAAVAAALDAYDDALEEAESEITDLEESHIEDAAQKVCDAVERPVGKRTFVIPRPEEFDRAIIVLHDAIGRNI